MFEPVHLRQAVADLKTALENADSVRGKSFNGRRSPRRREKFLNWRCNWRAGARRGFVPLGQMQNPPLTWRHDGRPALGDLITWTDWEQ